MKNLGIERSDSSNVIPPSSGENLTGYVANQYHDQVISELEQSIRVHVCFFPRHQITKLLIILLNLGYLFDRSSWKW